MIITLKGADVSSSNIGTLSTWTISYVLGNGATYDGATYVDKNAALSATVTIADGYELGSAGVTVTMGGVTQSGAYSQSGNVITISLASVTGTVIIKVPTVNTSTGEEDDGRSSDFVDVETLPGKAPVPNTGFVDKVYFNTDLSEDEIKNMLSALPYDSGEAVLLMTSSMSKFIVVVKVGDGYAIVNEQEQFLWCDEVAFELVKEQMGLTTAGWQEFTNPIEVNEEVISESEALGFPALIGSQNDKLVDLFYVGSGDKVELDKIYRVLGKEELKSTVVPNSGTVENVYFNTELTEEEVVSILGKLTTTSIQDNESGYIILYSTNSLILVQYLDNIPVLITGPSTEDAIWVSSSVASEFGLSAGWQEFTNPIVVNEEVNSSFSEMGIEAEVGIENNLISNLVSTTPFEKIKTETEYYRYYNNKWVQVLDEPLVVDVEELPSPTIYTSTEVPSSGLVEKIYINTELSNDKIFEIFNSLTYVDVYLEGMSIPQIYVVLTDSSMNKAIIISAYGGNISYVRDMANNDIVILWSRENGWESTLSELDINVENMLSVFASQLGMKLQNNKLTSLFSATPFKKTPNPDIKVDKLYRTPQFSGTEIPSSGAIGTIYFNTYLSVEDTVNVLKDLEYVDASGNGQLLVPILSNADMTNGLFIRKLGDGLYIMGGLVTDTNGYVTTSVIFSSYVEQGYGWLVSEFAFNNENMLSVLAPQVGVIIQNDKLTKLMTLDTFKASAYDYYQLKNGEWKEFGSGGSVENSAVVIEIIKDSNNNYIITDEIWNKAVENEVVVFKTFENSSDGATKLTGYALKNSYMTIGDVAYITALSSSGFGIGMFVIRKESDGTYVANNSNYDAIDAITSIDIAQGKLAITYNTFFENADQAVYGVNVDTETATDSNNLITSKAVRKYVEEYVAQYIATNNSSNA